MPLTRPQNSVIHVAKTKLALSDETYRCLLVHLTGATSSVDLDQEGFEPVMGYFSYLGFEPMKNTGPNYGTRPGMASFAQLELIRALWREWSGTVDKEVDHRGLNTWLRRTFKSDSLRFVTVAQAPKVITALKAMKAHKARAA